MAEIPFELKLSTMERMELKLAILVRVQQKERSLGNEVAGSDIYNFRRKEIDSLRSLAGRLQ